jgi:hygromycin-B 7''-O-kinase
MLLPSLPDLAAYRSLYRDEATWLPAMRAICAEQGLDPAKLALAPPGSHVVFRAGSELYIKLFAPLWESDYVSERAVLAALPDGPGRFVPRLVAEGGIEGWPYIVITRVRGVPLCEVWDELCLEARLLIARQCGAFMAWLHATPLAGLGEIAVDWPAFIRRQTEVRLQQIRDAGLPASWVSSVRALLDRLASTSQEDSRRVLLSADVTDEHVMVEQRGGGWRFSGYIDFGDAMLGHPLYEFAAPGCSIVRGIPSLARALLLGYGYTDEELDADLAERLTAHTLLHRYVTMADLFTLAAAPPRTLDELQGHLWPLAPGRSFA